MSWVVVVLSCWLAGAVAWAEEEPLGPRELVMHTSEDVLQTLRREKAGYEAHPERVYELVDKLVVPHFDFARMARWVLGKHWRAATAEQRQRFTEEFRNLLVRTYSAALLDYTDQRIEYDPLRVSPSDRKVAVVRTRVQRPGAPEVPIDYTMYRSARDWKVFDVSVDGISLVTTYRTSFGQEVRQHGIEGLIASLEARNAQRKQ